MSDLRAIIDEELDSMEYGEWQNKEMFDNLPDDEKVLADNLLATYDEVGPFDETENIYVKYQSQEENEDYDIGVKCENCVFYAAEDACVILAVKIGPGGKCRFQVIPPGYVGE